MALKLSNKDLKKLLSKNNIKDIEVEKTSKRSGADRLKDAIELLSSFETDDKIYFNKDSTKCLLEFNNILLISNNDSLRLGARQMTKYKTLWHERVKKLVSSEVLKKWKNSKEHTILIEFLYEVKANRFMDYDGRQAAFKAPLDGLTEAGLIYDDSEEYIPLVLGKQKKSSNGTCNLKIILSVEDDFDRFHTEEFLNIYKDK